MFNPDFVVFHKGCPDGITALLAVKIHAPDAIPIPCMAGQNPIEDFTDKNVIFVDICPSRAYLDELVNVAKFIVVLDHHETNKKVFDNPFEATNIHHVFDMKRSGCGITWDYFFPNKERPWLFNYVEDRDLWKWALADSKEISCCLMEENYFDGKNLDKLINILEPHHKNDFVERGKIYCKKNENDISNCCYHACKCELPFDGKVYNCWLSTVKRELRSDAGNELSKKHFIDGTLPDFSAIYHYDFPTNEFWISLRALTTSNINLCPISESFGGGGHPKACGFVLKNGSEKSIHNVFKLVTE